MIDHRSVGRFCEKRQIHTKEAILQGAPALVREQGVCALSLDKVARRAGICKGRLIHHFPSREALLLALQHQVFALGDAQFERQLAQEPDQGQRGRYLRAFLRCNLEMIRQGIPNQFASMAELAIAAPEVSAAEKQYFAEIRRNVENDGLDPILALIVTGPATIFGCK
ncbi:MAG: TetR/AcrR family transcriptional regulator [Acidobacteriota bacterium]